MYRKDYQVVSKIVIVAILSALGFILMSFAQLPYPLAPWLKIEFSEVTTLISFSLYSFPGGIIVGIIKTLLDLSVHGITSGLGIGNITALITSILYCVSFYLVSKFLKLFNKGFLYRLLGYVIITLFVSVILVLFNALFITPSFISGKYTTCFNSGIKESVTGALNAALKTNFDSYFLVIFILYFPFNLLKGVLVFVIYELLYKRLFNILVKSSPKMQKLFTLEKEKTSLDKANNNESKEDLNE